MIIESVSEPFWIYISRFEKSTSNFGDYSHFRFVDGYKNKALIDTGHVEGIQRGSAGGKEAVVMREDAAESWFAGAVIVSVH